MRRYYSVVLLPEEGQYTAVVPAIPGCVTQGDSVPDQGQFIRGAPL